MEIEDEEEEEGEAPAKKEGLLPDEEYEYKLIGVNVHMGHAAAGHYLSYINTSRSKSQLWG
jgi:ubiquitin C-terminal hydrolase